MEEGEGEGGKRGGRGGKMRPAQKSKSASASQYKQCYNHEAVRSPELPFDGVQWGNIQRGVWKSTGRRGRHVKWPNPRPRSKSDNPDEITPVRQASKTVRQPQAEQEFAPPSASTSRERGTGNGQRRTESGRRGSMTTERNQSLE
ncbi:hypothetical protein RRF57_000995 [Xylaria bambusicola]|uniref:Uncharacterized protein n=1 Tax=Xylaria bambusicola TaxID=326684 RepID=A0AAN7UPQ9_9PEZI